MPESSFPQRKSPRLQEFDYSSNNAYFVTICCGNRGCLFGTKQSDHIILSRIGDIAEQCWLAIPWHFPNVQLDSYVVMPNHLHGIVILSKTDQLPLVSLGRVINIFKGAVRRSIGQSVWQSRYHDHIIRNMNDADRIRKYIDQNPSHWESDELFEG